MLISWSAENSPAERILSVTAAVRCFVLAPTEAVGLVGPNDALQVMVGPAVSKSPWFPTSW